MMLCYVQSINQCLRPYQGGSTYTPKDRDNTTKDKKDLLTALSGRTLHMAIVFQHPTLLTHCPVLMPRYVKVGTYYLV